MNNVLALCHALPEMHIAAGNEPIEEHVPMGRIYVLKTGAFDMVRNGVRVVSIKEPGAFMGEISALLGSAPMASVRASREQS